MAERLTLTGPVDRQPAPRSLPCERIGEARMGQAAFSDSRREFHAVDITIGEHA